MYVCMFVCIYLSIQPVPPLMFQRWGVESETAAKSERWGLIWPRSAPESAPLSDGSTVARQAEAPADD